jgi:hypothetical protein
MSTLLNRWSLYCDPQSPLDWTTLYPDELCPVDADTATLHISERANWRGGQNHQRFGSAIDCHMGDAPSQSRMLKSFPCRTWNIKRCLGGSKYSEYNFPWSQYWLAFAGWWQPKLEGVYPLQDSLWITLTFEVDLREGAFVNLNALVSPLAHDLNCYYLF